MNIKLFEHQSEVLNLLDSGSILCGGVGSGKSITSLAYYFVNESGGSLNPFSKMTKPKDLYIITTARKRDTLEWHKECLNFLLSTKKEDSINGVKVVIDSWNNIGKYADVQNSFFIFDEQRLVGYGAWVKFFLKIAKKNRWILLTATPGDTWLDYIPVFIANGFYKNRTEFLRKHVIFNKFTNFPKVEKFVNTNELINLRKKILVNMQYSTITTRHTKYITVEYDKQKYDQVTKTRWNVFKDQPVANISELCSVWRQITNTHHSRINAIANILEERKKIIVFYNYNYELYLLREFIANNNITSSEWNGWKHEPIPKTDSWLYLVQYTAGAEGWNCIDTNAILFYSQNYSYKVMKQAAGRIDRLNTPFKDLYYYHLVSSSKMDLAIKTALINKKSFNEKVYVDRITSRQKHRL